MNNLRNNSKFVYNNKDIVFQCLDWLGTNESIKIEQEWNRTERN